MTPLVWLVSGCSSGIGEEFVKSIIARGDRVIATARDITKLKSLQDVGAAIIQLDITNNEQQIRTIVARAIEIYGRIDVLVNNAGFIMVGTWEDLNYEDWLAQFDTNVFGTIKLTRALLPHFRQRRSGTLVFISSLSGWIGHSDGSAYAASKFALEGAIEGLQKETAHLGIRTLLIEPGRFRTKLLSTGNMKAVRSKILEYESSSKDKMEGLAREDQAQPGDPAKLVQIVLAMVCKEGIAEGKDIPFRLPLGPDCYDEIKSKCEETLQILQEWEPVIQSTNYDD